jgi:hypothetical protein
MRWAGALVFCVFLAAAYATDAAHDPVSHEHPVEVTISAPAQRFLIRNPNAGGVRDDCSCIVCGVSLLGFPERLFFVHLLNMLV